MDLNDQWQLSMYDDMFACEDGIDRNDHMVECATKSYDDNCRNNYHITLCKMLMENGYPNAWGARIPVKSSWNIQLLKGLLQNYHDYEVIDWLTYGWPISRPPNWKDLIPSFRDHASALQHPESINKYIEKEKNRGVICGPFDQVPFVNRVGVSPLSTRAKKDSQDRRILMDLSWPIGESVNDGIAKDQFMGFKAKLTLPTVDAIARRIMELTSKSVWLFKINLTGYFRQLPLDPGDYSLLCFIWQNKVYFDVVSPQGLRSTPYFAQRMSNAIRYIHNSLHYFLFKYIDDLIGVEEHSKIWDSFTTLQRTLRDLGLKEAENKRVQPTQVINCVGTLVNAENMTLGVLPERTMELMKELLIWKNKVDCTVKEVQSMVGKLQFICAVVRPGRIFLGRMLEFLRAMSQYG